MGHRATPNRSETLAVMRHLADVAALKADPPAQAQLLADGLGRLFGADLGWVYAIDDARPGRILRPALAAIASHRDPAWMKYMDDFAVHVPPTADPYADHLVRSDDADQQWVRSRVLPDVAAHHRYAPAVAVMRAARIGDGAVCAFRTGPAGDRMVGFSLHRPAADRRMTARDYALHRFALAEVRGLVDRGHLTVAAASRRLPPQLRHVLGRMKRGQAPKIMARQMGLSVHTVRDHIKRLYAEYRVHGRDELMAKFLGDGDGDGEGDGDGTDGRGG